MSEATPKLPTAKPRGKATLFVVGTAVILLTAGIVYQIFRAEPAAAVVEPETDEPGTARVMKYVARVNNVPITYDEVARECYDMKGREVLENLINRAIIQQACQKRGVTVSEAEVTAEIARIAQKFQMPIQTWLEMLQAERGLTPAQYRSDVIWPMLALKKLAGDDIRVTNEDLQKTFERDYGVMVKARMIMFDNFRRAQEVYEKARQAPDRFDELAQEHSVEPNSRALGGTIPHIRRHSGNPQLENVAFRLREGEISGIIQIDESGSRYVILKCEGFTDPVVKNIQEVKDDLYLQVREEKTQEAVARVFEQIKTEARVDNYLTRTSTGGTIKQTAGQETGLASPEDVRPAAAQLRR